MEARWALACCERDMACRKGFRDQRLVAAYGKLLVAVGVAVSAITLLIHELFCMSGKG